MKSETPPPPPPQQEPPRRPEPLLKQGMLIAFSISLAGTADRFPDTPEVRQALKRLTSKRYLGVVRFADIHWSCLDYYPGPNDPPPLEMVMVGDVAQHLPTATTHPLSSQFLDVTKFCVPIHTPPTPPITSPPERPPLKLSPHPAAFPFDNVLAYTTLDREIAVENIYRREDGGSGN